MLFGIEADDGGAVRGWVRPDNPAAIPSILVETDDGRRILIPARADKPDQRVGEARWGFTIDERTCPDIVDSEGFAVYEPHSHTLIYRRAAHPVVPMRLLHLETHARRSLAPVLGTSFQMSYGWTEFMGEESLKSVLTLRVVPSLLVTGVLSLRRIARELSQGAFRRSILLGDPIRRLSETLLDLKDLAEGHGVRGGWRAQGRGPILARLAGADLSSPSGLGKVLGRLDLEDLRQLADPVTRQLAATATDQTLGEAHVSAALEQLAGFDVIGFEDETAHFAHGLRLLTGRSYVIDPVRNDDSRLRDLEAVVASTTAARNLIAMDTDLVLSARAALERAGR